MLLSGLSIDYAICIEADGEIYKSLKRNVVEVFANAEAANVGLGDKYETVTFYKDAGNHGNNSFLRASMEHYKHDATTAEMVDTADYFMRIGSKFKHPIIWKSDTQGLDEVIVSRVPWNIWSAVDMAIIEISRIEKPYFDQEEFARRISLFTTILIDGKAASSNDVMRYLTGNDGEHADLFVCRR